jgi:hypothetical protein
MVFAIRFAVVINKIVLVESVVQMELATQLRKPALLTMVAPEALLIVVRMEPVLNNPRQLMLQTLVHFQLSVQAVSICAWTEVVSRNKVYVSHYYAFLQQHTVTLVVTQIALQLHKNVLQKVQFFAPVELVLPVLLFVEIQRPVVSRTLTALALHQLHAPTVDVWPRRPFVSLKVLMRMVSVSGERHQQVKTRTVVVLLV